jgi:type II secretory pathway pseudopilin PulG
VTLDRENCRRRPDEQAGFTLASLLVVLTIMAIVIAYSVPSMWSQIMHRERDRQTIWVMKQYARSIEEYQRKRGSLPASLEQLKEQQKPRILRQLYKNPLSGELDWILVPAGQGAMRPVQAPVGGNPAGYQPPPGVAPPPGTPRMIPKPPDGSDPKGYRGPFVGVRPPQTGQSFLALNGAESYETWIYTIEDIAMERMQQGGQPGAPGGNPGGPGGGPGHRP